MPVNTFETESVTSKSKIAKQPSVSIECQKSLPVTAKKVIKTPYLHAGSKPVADRTHIETENKIPKNERPEFNKMLQILEDSKFYTPGETTTLQINKGCKMIPIYDHKTGRWTTPEYKASCKTLQQSKSTLSTLKPKLESKKRLKCTKLFIDIDMERNPSVECPKPYITKKQIIDKPTKKSLYVPSIALIHVPPTQIQQRSRKQRFGFLRRLMCISAENDNLGPYRITKHKPVLIKKS